MKYLTTSKEFIEKTEEVKVTGSMMKMSVNQTKFNRKEC